MKTQVFTAEISAGDHGGAGIYIPFDVKEVFGKARAKVKVTINNFSYRTTTAVMGGQYVIPVRKEVRDAAGKSISEKVKVIMEPDMEERIVIVPEDFRKILNKNKPANEIFCKMAYTHRKEYVQWIESAKKPETRINRIQKAVEMISDGKNFS